MKRLLPVLVILVAGAIVGIAIHLTGGRGPTTAAPPRVALPEERLPSAPGPPEDRAPRRPQEVLDAGAPAPAGRRPLERAEKGAVVLRGRVVEKDTRRPLAGARVVTTPEMQGPAWMFGLVGGMIDELTDEAREGEAPEKPRKRTGPLATTGEDGTFELLASAALEKEALLAIEADWHYVRDPVKATPGGAFEVILEAARGGRLSGRIFDEEGRPVAGGTVSLLSSFGILSSIGDAERRPVRRQVPTGGDGAFAFGGVPPGAYRVAAKGEGLTPVDQDGIRLVEGQERRLELRGSPGGSVSGVVRNEKGSPVAGALVRAASGEEVPFLFSGLSVAKTKSDAEGRFLLAHLRAGSVELTASSPGLVPKKLEEPSTVEVRARETAGPVEIVLRPAAVIAVVVLDPEGNPAADAEVELPPGFHAGDFLSGNWPRAPRRSKVRTAKDGAFRLEGIAEDGPFAVTARKKPFAPGHAAGVAAGTTDLRIALEPSSGIAGRVIDPSREEPVKRFKISARPSRIEKDGTAHPVIVSVGEGAPVEASESVRFNPHEVVRSERFEDEGGKFLLEGLPAGTYTLSVEAEGFVEEEVNGLEVRRGEVKRGVIVAMAPAGSIAGRVFDPLGAPKEGARVLARPAGEKGNLDHAFSGLLGANRGGVKTDADGGFDLKNLKPGAFDVIASAEGSARGTAKGIEVASGEAREGVVVRLRAGGSVYGTVADRNGRPLPSRAIAAFSMGAGAAGRAESAGDGSYEIVGLEQGSYMVFLEKEGGGAIPFLGGGMQIETAAIREGERTRLDIVDESAAGCRVLGTVRRGGRPVPNAYVIAAREGAGLFPGMPTSFQPVRADADGRYEFASLAPGEYAFRVGDTFEGEGTKIPAEVPDREEFFLDLEIPETAVAGRVTDAATGKPLQSARVRLVSAKDADREDLGEFSDDSTDYTGEEGKFRFPNVAPGLYALLVSKTEPGESYAPARIEGLRVEPDRGLGDLVVRLERGGAIRIALSAPDGKVVEHAFAEVERSGEPLRRPSLEGSGDGKVEIGGLESGTYSVIVHAAGFASARVEGIAVERGAIVERGVTLEKGTALSVVLLDRRCERSADATFEVLDAGGRRLTPGGAAAGVMRMLLPLFAGADAAASPDLVGRFAPGVYRIRALREGKEVATGKVELAGEEAREVTLREE